MGLCQTFRDLSYQTWTLLGKARSVNHQVLEETITDINLLKLKLSHSDRIFTKTFNKFEEGINGADWEWWFVDSTGTKGIGFRVQAKILNLKTNAFEQLHYKKNGVFQSEKLVKDASSSTPKLIPLYCLYLHIDKTSVSKVIQLKRILFNYYSNFSIEHYGCSLLSIESLKDLKIRSKKHISDLADYIFPWHYLICSGDEDTSKSFLENVEILCKEMRINYDNIQNNIVQDVPIYVQNIIYQQNDNIENDNQIYNTENLRGIMVIKEKNN